jgi:hypothetical protein
MRIFLALFCSLALACLAGAQEPPKGKEKEKPKKGAPAGHVSAPGGKAYGKPTGAGRPAEVGKPTGKPTGVGRPAEAGRLKGKPSGVGGKPTEVGKPATVGKAKGKPSEFGKPTEAGKPPVAGKPAKGGKPMVAGKPFKPQRFTNLSTKTRPAGIPNVNFQQGRHIPGSQNWQGANYTVFRNYNSEWHDRGWWHSHSNNVVFIFGGWYALNGGYWYPAWGYAPNSYYAYDGPIYAYNNLPPDQVIANVQTALQEQGYYQGEVDGVLGPQTSAAIADYQRANGLPETAAIDQPTLESLGMA